MTGKQDEPLGHRYDRSEVEDSIAPLGLPGTLVHPVRALDQMVALARVTGSFRACEGGSFYAA
jgi:hypothetical protein